ncbi:MAG: ATP-dependent DNA helicase RecG [Firmicutes bacterium]|nr:ATP-dependent DNA helicase RecG [Bacillota bacterium]
MKDLLSLKGIGNKTLLLLNKLGINNSEQLLTYFPFRYDIFKRSNIYELGQDDKIIIDGIVETKPTVFHFNRKMDKMSFKLNASTHLLNVTIFNRGFLKNKLEPGMVITIIGKYDKKHNSVTASDIRFDVLSDTPKIEPVYHSISGITSKQISNYIHELLKEEIHLQSYIPEYIQEKYNFLKKEESIKIIHNPKEAKSFKQALNHIKYEELFLFMLKMNYLRNNKNNKIGLKRSVDFNEVQAFIDELPFSLTIDQEKSVKEIYNDLISEKRMNRLLQGDVGSGKTVIAFISLYINYLSGYQGALMAPTEILANQHFANIQKLFKKFNMNICLLTGKTKAKEKKQIYEDLKNGKINIIIGTHALIQEDVKYHNLGLVITDEQHRFGVNQRGNLKNKGVTPDILYMSATPIPRTYALTLYGDMDISSIKTMPSGRKEVITYLKKENEIADILNKMFNELKQKHQIYVVAPLIEESDKINLENVEKLEEKMNKAFGKFYNIGVMHGKMTNVEKDNIMNKFKNNEIQILISTTVIEVGVDVANATMMVIFDAFRFGLSALHQLRGRVGRNSLQSYCILISDKETERLQVLTQTTDGFKISEEDFRLRGSGDLFGVKQSGDMAFKLADIKKDFNILKKAKEDSLEFLESCEYQNLKYEHIKKLIETSNNLD